MKPTINKRKCPAQKDVCKVIAACPPHAIRYVEDVNEPLGGEIVIDEGLCDACGICVTECCGDAIDMIAA
jgi:Pyruvate/2-oxoacid:ferredoxin oxidoreductase delta subunit